MASTNPFQHTTDAPIDSVDDGSRRLRGRKRSNGKAEGTGYKARQKAIREALPVGLPTWESLKPVLIFLLFPALLAILLVVTGGGWPKPVLYGVAGILGMYVVLSAFVGVELVMACMIIYFPLSKTFVIPVAPGLNGTNLLIALGLFATYLYSKTQRHTWFNWMPGTAMVFFFALYTALSGLTAIAQPDGYAFLMYEEFLNYKGWLDQFILYFIILSCVRDVEMAKRLVIYMCIGSVITVLFAIPEMFEKSGRATIDKSRIGGSFKQPNNFGGFVAYTLLPIGAIFLTYIKYLKAWLLTPYFLVALKVLITTFSRGAYLAMALGGLMAAYFKGRGFLMFWAAIAISFVLVFPSLVPQAITDRLGLSEQEGAQSVEQGLDKSSESRLVLWRAAALMVIEDPIFGKGFKGFQRFKSDYTEVSVHESDPHSMYLYLASQMGLPALALFLIIMLYMFHMGRVLSRSKEDLFIRAIGIGGAAIAGCYGAIGLFGSRAVNAEYTMYFWAYFIALQVIMQSQKANGTAAKPKRHRTNAFEAKEAALQSDHVALPDDRPPQRALNRKSESAEVPRQLTHTRGSVENPNLPSVKAKRGVAAARVRSQSEPAPSVGSGDNLPKKDTNIDTSPTPAQRLKRRVRNNPLKKRRL